jgi:hypothetical protein
MHLTRAVLHRCACTRSEYIVVAGCRAPNGVAVRQVRYVPEGKVFGHIACKLEMMNGSKRCRHWLCVHKSVSLYLCSTQMVQLRI